MLEPPPESGRNAGKLQADAAGNPEFPSTLLTLPLPHPSLPVEFVADVLDALKGGFNHAKKTLSSRGDHSQASGSRGGPRSRNVGRRGLQEAWCYRADLLLLAV